MVTENNSDVIKLIRKNKNIFDLEVGAIQGAQATIFLNNAQLVFIIARSVPLALQPPKNVGKC